MQLENEINNNIEIEKNQNNFFESMIGKVVNNAIDIGLKTILPDVIENQIIDIKNSLLQNGIKAGIKTAINSMQDFAKSTLGIFTGKFDNISQIDMAIRNGGIIDTFSNILDKAIDKTYLSGKINRSINTMLKKGKNIILENISNNIEKEIKSQDNYINNLKENLESWKKYYNNKNFDGMEKEFKNIENKIEKIIPLENIIKETRQVEIIHNLIKNNGHNFNISELEKEVSNKLSTI